MQKVAKCILELSWRYYEECVEEISVRCLEYMVYISFLKKLTTHGACMSSEIWTISFFLMRRTYLTFHAVEKSGFRSSRVRVTSINSKIKRRHVKNKQS